MLLEIILSLLDAYLEVGMSQKCDFSFVSLVLARESKGLSNGKTLTMLLIFTSITNTTFGGT
jgi:hypothetical protein